MRALALTALLCGQTCLAALLRTEFPHLIIPLVSSSPDTAFGTQKDATIRYDPATNEAEYIEVSFDVPVNKAANCRLQFYLNTSPAKNAPRALSGTPPYTFNISRLSPNISEKSDTWNEFPDVLEYVTTVEVTSGGVRWQAENWFPCPKGRVAQFLIRPSPGRALEFYWFELDYGVRDGGPHGIVLEMHT